jgi:hypothetical protein
MTEKKLLSFTGDHSENPTLDLACEKVLTVCVCFVGSFLFCLFHSVFAAGQKKIEVFGPFPEVEEEIAAVHKSFWSKS